MSAPRSEQQKAWQKTLFWLILLSVIHAVYLVLNHRNLNVDEAQYWSWSQHLQWGYHSKPPFIAGCIWLTTHVFGSSLAAVRLSSVLAYFFGSIGVYLATQRLFSPKAALWASVGFLLLPGVTFSASIISTDPFMLCFWAWALWAWVKLISDDHWLSALLCGVFLGLGFLSKYTILIFFIGIVWGMIVDARQRRVLKSLNVLILILSFLIVAWPNIQWNILHGFTTARHIIFHNADIHGMHWHGGALFDFWSSQLAVGGPVLVILFIGLLFSIKSLWTDWRYRLLLGFTLPILVIISIEAILSRAYANWAAPAYISMMILAAGWASTKNKMTWLKWMMVINVILAVLFYGAEISAQHSTGHTIIPHYRQRNLGWTQLGAEVRHDLLAYPHIAGVVANQRNVMMQTWYYAKLKVPQVFVWNPSGSPQSQWDVPNHLAKNNHKRYLFITLGHTLPSSIRHQFISVNTLRPVVARWHGQVINHLNIFLVSGFKGYA